MTRKIFVLAVLSVTCLKTLAGESARSELVFPVFAITQPVQTSCDFWGTQFTVFNPNGTPVNVTLTAFDFRSPSIQESSFLVVNGFNFATHFFRNHRTGWVKVNADQPVIVKETIEHLRGCPTGFPTVIDVRSRIHLAPADAVRRRFIAVDFNKSQSRNTGVSIVFPSRTSTAVATGKLVHRWIDGRKVSEKEIAIPANGQFIGLITELLPPESLTFSPFDLIVGSLELTFDKDVFITAIHFGTVVEPKEEDLDEPLSGTF